MPRNSANYTLSRKFKAPPDKLLEACPEGLINVQNQAKGLSLTVLLDIYIAAYAKLNSSVVNRPCGDDIKNGIADCLHDGYLAIGLASFELAVKH